MTRAATQDLLTDQNVYGIDRTEGDKGNETNICGIVGTEGN